MSTLAVTLHQSASSRATRATVEVDLEKMRQLADTLGFYHPQFLEDIEQAEKEITQGKTRRIHSSQDILA